MIRSRWLASLLIVAALSVSSAARADKPMDITLGDLQGRDGDPTNDGLVGGPEFAWKRLMSQLGGSIAPPVLEPANTVGPGGFHVGVDTFVTGIDDNKHYWELGTRGDNRLVVENPDVRSAYTWFRLGVRKGLPFGFELGASAAHALFTDYWAWGFSLKWALFEGFRTGIGYLPDVAVRAAVQTMTGPSEFNLTVPSVDLIISKPIVIAKTAKLTPYVAGQAQWIVADSEVVDLTPGRNAYDTCAPYPPVRSQQENTNHSFGGNPDDPAMNSDPNFGQRATFACSAPDMGLPNYDFNNNHVFSQIRALRTRLAVGFQYRYMAFTLNGSFSFDLLPPGKLDDSVVTYTDYTDPMNPIKVKDENALPRQWTAALGIGFTY